LGRGSDAVRIRCDLSTTGRTWDFAAFGQAARLIHHLHAVEPGGWLFSNDVLEVDGLQMDDAIGVARDLVDIASAGRFLRDGHDASTIPSNPTLPVSPQVTMERSDRWRRHPTDDQKYSLVG
jgi:hypothetical protein